MASKLSTGSEFNKCFGRVGFLEGLCGVANTSSYTLTPLDEPYKVNHAFVFSSASARRLLTKMNFDPPSPPSLRGDGAVFFSLVRQDAG